MSRTYLSTPALPFRTSPCRPCHSPLHGAMPILACLVLPSLAPPGRALPGPSWPHLACLVSPCISQPHRAQQRLSRLDPACQALPSLALTCLFLAPLHPSRPALIFPSGPLHSVHSELRLPCHASPLRSYHLLAAPNPACLALTWFHATKFSWQQGASETAYYPVVWTAQVYEHANLRRFSVEVEPIRRPVNYIDRTPD